MTDKIQRYYIDAPDGFFDYEDDDGDYVKYKDHIKAIEAKDREIHYAEMAANQEAKWLDEAQEKIKDQAKEIERLMDEIEGLQEMLESEWEKQELTK